MARLKMQMLPYVHAYQDRHGKLRHYFRRRGFPKVSLPGVPGSTEFMDTYQLALAGKAAPIGANRTKAGTMNALRVAWYQSTAFKTLAKSTQGVYRNVVERFVATHGNKLVMDLEPRHIRSLIAEKAETPEAANQLLKMLRHMLRFAVTDGWRDDDPTFAIRKIRVRTDGFHTWTDEEISAFRAFHSLGTRARLALELALCTGLRRSDLIRAGRQHLRDGRLEIVTQKTGARISIPIHTDLRAALDACPSDHLTFLTTQAGAAFTAAGFGNYFRDIVRDAGLPIRCSVHGLRKAICRRLAEAGCSPHEIMAITGHKTLAEIERYTREANRTELATSAMRAISGSGKLEA